MPTPIAGESLRNRGAGYDNCFAMLVNALMGLFVAALYHPNSPLDLFPGAQVEELWLWAKYAIFLSALLTIFTLLASDSDMRGRDIARSLAAFTTLLQGILNLPPVVLYIVLLHGARAAEITPRRGHITITYGELFLHIILVIISFSSAAWLTLAKPDEPCELHTIVRSDDFLEDIPA